jgi:hypothetical protein
MTRRRIVALGFATGILVGSVVFRRSFSRPRERVEVYFEDGSMVSLVEGSLDADKLLPVARQALSAARR